MFNLCPNLLDFFQFILLLFGLLLSCYFLIDAGDADIGFVLFEE